MYLSQCFRFYLVLLRQPIAPMEADGMSRVYQM